MREFKFNGYEVKVQPNPVKAKILAVIGTAIIICLIELVGLENAQTWIAYCLLGGFVFLGLYFIYFKLYQQDVIRKKYFIIREDGFLCKEELFLWEEVQDLYIKYVSHTHQFARADNESNIIAFVYRQRAREFHFTLSNEADLQLYVDMLHFLYEKRLNFVEEKALFGRTFLMNNLTEEQIVQFYRYYKYDV